MDPDPQLLPFLSSNDALPDQLIPMLNDHLPRRIDASDSDQPIEDDAELKQLQGEHDECSSLKAPIRHIPGEILASIIHWAIGERETFLHLRQVSTLWRSTAFSTPLLWRYLRVELDTLNNISPNILLLARYIRHMAEVHLAFGGPLNPGRQGFAWISTVWGLQQRTYRLTTALLWGNIFTGVGDHHPKMPHIASLSIPSESASSFKGRSGNLDDRFIGLESLALKGSSSMFPHLQPVHHSNLRSLFLSRLHLERSDLVMTLKELPRLKELIIHSSVFMPAWDTIQKSVQPSIERLICTHTIFFHWPDIQLPSLKLFKLLRDNVDQVKQAEEELAHWAGIQDNSILDPLSFCNSEYLTLDLASSDIELENVIPFLQRIGPIETLLVDTAEPLLSDTALEQEWRRKSNVKTIVSRRFVSLPSSFTTTTLTLATPPSTPPSFSLFSPTDSCETRSGHLRCLDSSNMTESVSIDFIRLPKWRIDSLCEDLLPIRNHEFGNLLEEIEAYAAWEVEMDCYSGTWRV
ncbi:hypothetical protein BKA70DRAFT_1289186 [Coprinopsis sp. MPI-PUGE-AT-0042]|nr:hypothetical protein BKA70DRAFT_1289186 [Coprinopsis sp. MPI-PUGE-AT-0042]